MIYFLCGLATMASAWAVIGGLRRRGLPADRWHWLLLGIGFLLLAFTLAVIAAFLTEGAVRGAIVTGSLMAVVTAVWGVGTARIVTKALRGEKAQGGPRPGGETPEISG